VVVYPVVLRSVVYVPLRALVPLLARLGDGRVMERTLSWLNRYRRLKVRYERRADVHQALLYERGHGTATPIVGDHGYREATNT
jgi:hypothetical protein